MERGTPPARFSPHELGFHGSFSGARVGPGPGAENTAPNETKPPLTELPLRFHTRRPGCVLGWVHLVPVTASTRAGAWHLRTGQSLSGNPAACVFTFQRQGGTLSPGLQPLPCSSGLGALAPLGVLQRSGVLCPGLSQGFGLEDQGCTLWAAPHLARGAVWNEGPGLSTGAGAQDSVGSAPWPPGKS